MASVFEFHFNPLPRRSLGEASLRSGELRFGKGGLATPGPTFDTFYFLPQTLFEKKQGYLYIIAEIKNSNPQSQQILSDLAEIVKKYFFQKPVFSSHDPFQLGLNQANDYLSQWQGDLHFAAVAVGPKANIKVSKTGNIKIILFRGQEAFDIGSNFSSLPQAGKIFPDVIEGNLQKADRLLLSTSEVFNSLQAEKILDDLSLCQEPKLVKHIFKEKKKIVREFSGACLLAYIKKRPLISLLTRF